MSVKSAVKPTTYESLRRNADDLRRVLKALAPEQNKEGSLEILYDVARNWNLRAKRKDRKFQGEWLFRSHPQYIREGIATHQSKSERSLRSLVDYKLVERKLAALGDNLKTIHLQPSSILEQTLTQISTAIDSLLGMIPVRKFLLPLLDWNKKYDPEPTSLHYVFRKFRSSGEMDFDMLGKIMAEHIEKLKASASEEDNSDDAEKIKKKTFKVVSSKAKKAGWDDEPAEIPVTKTMVNTPPDTDTSDGIPGGQNHNFDGSLYSNKGTKNKGTKKKGTGLTPDDPQVDYKFFEGGGPVAGVDDVLSATEYTYEKLESEVLVAGSINATKLHVGDLYSIPKVVNNADLQWATLPKKYSNALHSYPEGQWTVIDWYYVAEYMQYQLRVQNLFGLEQKILIAKEYLQDKEPFTVEDILAELGTPKGNLYYFNMKAQAEVCANKEIPVHILLKEISKL